MAEFIYYNAFINIEGSFIMYDFQICGKKVIVLVFIFLMSSIFIPCMNAEYAFASPVQSEGSLINTISTLNSEGNLRDLSGPMDSAWPTYGHDNRHTGQSPYNTRDNPMDVKWRFEADYLGFKSSPVIDQNGVLYLPARDNYLYALNTDGSVRWRYKINDWGSDSPALAEDGTIYIGSLDNKLYAVNPDGSLNWRFDAQYDIIESSPTVGDDGTIYFGVIGPDFSGRVYAVNPDGSEKWHLNVSGCVYSTPAIGDDGTVYVTSYNRYLYALDPSDGSVIWKYRAGDVFGSPSIGVDGTIYVPSHDDYLYAINPDGSLQWRTYIDYGSSDTPAIGDDGTIYIGEKYFYAVNPDGSFKWIYKGWEDEGEYYEVTSSAYAISADGLVYFVATKGGGHGGDLFVLNCGDGSLFWRKTIASNGDLYSQPVIGGDGTVYIGSEFVMGTKFTGYLYAFGWLDENYPPNSPNIYGSTSGKSGESYSYVFTGSDPDGDTISFYVNWGDGSNSGWLGPYESGESIELSHNWSKQGYYTIKAKVMDEHNVESDWSTLDISMPRVKSFNYIISRFLCNHPRFMMFNQWFLGRE